MESEGSWRQNLNEKQEGLLEKILAPENMAQAAQRVKAKKGAGGTDGMSVQELDSWLEERQEELIERLRDGKYRPQPVRRVEIPKDNGKTRKLGIPTVKDGRVVSLIHKYLRAGIMVNGMFEESKEGVPQGGPLSPLLGNVMLNERDRELEARQQRFVRYADDMVIFCKSRKAAERTLASITKFIEGKLFLKVNREKTVVAYVSKIKFLGHGFYVDKDGGQLRVHPKSVQKLKMKIREITGRSNGWSIQYRKDRLNALIRGWVNYYKLAKMKNLLEELDGWIRRRLRMVTWKRWKRNKSRFTNLMKAGISKWWAWQWANTRRGYWAIAGCAILTRAIPNAMLAKAGYLTLSGCYAKVK